MIWNYSTPGIPEELFQRGDVPITKGEVRMIALCKLKLQRDSTLLDIGCGTGSITVEAALCCPEGQVAAVDRNEKAVELTRANVSAFGLSNVEVISGSAPECLPERSFSRIFIGGGSNHMDKLISYSYNHLRDDGIVVANTIIIESTYKVLKSLEEYGFKNIECVCLNVARGERQPHSGWMMKALNPVYIISASK